MLHRTLRQ